MVRRVGPRVPHDPVRAGRSAVRQGAARCCSCASGTCTRTARSRRTSSRFGDVNPPVHAWAVLARLQDDRRRAGSATALFLARVFQKLLLNFTWWVNRKDVEGKQPLRRRLPRPRQHRRLRPLASRCPTGGHLEQADGTAWMAFYCATMLVDGARAGAATIPPTRTSPRKFFEHFVAIADAMNTLGGTGLWDEEDGFYYDQLHVDGHAHAAAGPLDGRAASRCSPSRCSRTTTIDRLPGFRKRHATGSSRTASDLAGTSRTCEPRRRDGHGHRLLAIPSRERLERVLRYVLDENEFLSPYGIRSLSRVHREQPVRASTSTARSTASTTCRASRTPGSSAATRTGAGRSGSRSTTCSSRRSSATTTSTATRCRSSARPARAACMNLQRGRARARARGSRGSSCPTRAAGGPATATTRATPTIRTGGTSCSSTSTSTATPAAASAPATRPAGRRSSPRLLGEQQ